jgi:hypothetical protein
MTTFGCKFPHARAYLEAIPPVRWVHYAQIEAKASTFGWRSNNIGEIGQGNVLQGFRKCHPLDFFSQLLQKTISIITKEASEHVIWKAQDHLNPTQHLVPHGLKLFRERSRADSKLKVTLVGDGGTVKSFDSSSGVWSEHVVHMALKSCTYRSYTINAK